MSKGKKILIAVGYMLAFFVVPMMAVVIQRQRAGRGAAQQQ